MTTLLKTKMTAVIAVLLLTLPQFLIAQPKERTKNRYKEVAMNYGAPYTLFDLMPGNSSTKESDFQREIEEIRSLIQMGGNERTIYNGIYTSYISAANPSPVDKADEEIDALSLHAKNKAFLAIIGLDNLGNPMDAPTIARLKNEVYSALESMNTEVVNIINLRFINAGSLLLYRCAELENYLEAYDMLKACGRIANYDQDKNDVQQNPRNRLREFTRNIYKTGMGWAGAVRWGDNHSLRFCGAIGMAAVVLNDAGAANLRIHYRPDRWADRAHTFLNKKMWEGSWFAPRLAVEGQISGYAEGPNYYEYMMELVMPFLRAMHNLVPEGSSRDYLSTSKWDELFQWRYELTLPSGKYFPYDNSAYGNENSLLLTGKQEYNFVPKNTVPNHGSSVDFLAMHPALNPVDSRKGSINLPDAGVSVLRMNSAL